MLTMRGFQLHSSCRPTRCHLSIFTALLYEAEKVKVFIIEGDRAKEREVKLRTGTEN